MIKPGRKDITFPLTTENRIMLLEIRTILSACNEDIELSEIINSALKSYLPSVLSSLRRIKSDNDLNLLYDTLRLLEEEYHAEE